MVDSSIYSSKQERGAMELEQGVVDMAWLLCGAALALAAFAGTWRIVECAWLKPRRIERALRSQGLRGTSYRLLGADLEETTRLTMEACAKPLPLGHDIVPRVDPMLSRSMSQYGKISFNWLGRLPRVVMVDPQLVREILANKFGNFGKPTLTPITRQFITGIINLEGEKWATHRRIINPAFHVEKLKRMLPAFSACCDELITRWENSVSSEGVCEIDVCPEFQNFTADVISRTAFGSSFSEGKRIFQLQTEAIELFFKGATAPHILSNRFLPTAANIRRKEIDREVKALLGAMIEKREIARKSGEATKDDLLGLLLESNIRHSEEQGNGKSAGMTREDVIEECKLFYFGGQETTSVLLQWTMVVLSIHPNWQERAREEVMQVFGNRKPDYDGLSCLKIVSMILYEVLRLYPPVPLLGRITYKATELGGITYPAGLLVILPILLLHHDPEYWGEDVHEFKPERFAEGLSKVAFFPFGAGPRICIGQSFALIEARLALSRILQQFSFELSPSYTHAPHTVFTLQPQHGAPVMLHKL